MGCNCCRHAHSWHWWYVGGPCSPGNCGLAFRCQERWSVNALAASRKRYFSKSTSHAPIMSGYLSLRSLGATSTPFVRYWWHGRVHFQRRWSLWCHVSNYCGLTSHKKKCHIHAHAAIFTSCYVRDKHVFVIGVESNFLNLHARCSFTTCVNVEPWRV